MNAQAQFLCPDPAPEPTDPARPVQYDFGPVETRYDGWTPDKQAIFLRVVSEGHSITHCCRVVRMTKQSAYALRRSARGAGFALGWQAALILGRERLADEMLDRALNGVVETITTPNGEVTERHRHDNRLGMAMLSRMDRVADAARADASHAAARLVAQDFDQYLDLVGRDGGPARAGLFLGARADAAAADELAPIRALARADKWLRTHTDLAEPVDATDLDPAARAGWTGEQWGRAEAVGLVQLAPPADARDGSGKLGQPDDAADAKEPVWWDMFEERWRTHFPPPEDFDGEEDGAYGDEGYSRTLSDAEEAAWETEYRAEVAAREAAEARDRDRYFGFLVEPEPEAAPAPDEPDEPSDTPRRKSRAGSCVEPLSAPPPGARTGAPVMSIFGKIKDAIFGHKAAAPAAPTQAPAQAPGQPAAQSPAMPQMQQPAAAAPAQPVDVEMVLMVFETERGTADLNWRTSIVDLLKLIDLDSSLENRKALAAELGYGGTLDGSAEMNLWLHKAVMQALEKNGGKVPAGLKD
ncbi:DUF3597 domain-containing protein [Sphingomonas sp.]|uniref:DUF3597 domain-containing protein n=1 Tax=Sphingomonas sp. TaxID=28214 RepID=UPI00342E1B74